MASFFISHPLIHPCETGGTAAVMEIARKGEEKEESMKNEERKETHFLCEVRPVQMDDVSLCLSICFLKPNIC